ncbi:unnamed protein product, partial [Adineta ricciae]
NENSDVTNKNISTDTDRLELKVFEFQSSIHPLLTSINSGELAFVEKQRSAHSNIQWYPDSVDQYRRHKLFDKPSEQWWFCIPKAFWK